MAQSDANKEAAVAEGALEGLVALAVGFRDDSAVLREVSDSSGATQQPGPTARTDQGWPFALKCPVLGLRPQTFLSMCWRVQSMGALGALTLRAPAHAERAAKAGALEVAAEMLQSEKLPSSTVRQTCNALRTMAVRSDAVR